MYKPLPKQLRLGFSDIHDIGIFAKEGIAQGTNLGMTHIKVADHLIRTPLGGFLNHSDNVFRRFVYHRDFSYFKFFHFIFTFN